MKHIFGALKPKIDKRDYLVRSGNFLLPNTYVCDYLPQVKNQKSVSSCVAHATSSILEHFAKKENGENIKLSTNFIYGMQGIMFNQLQQGMLLRDACKIVQTYGDPLEETIKGNIEQPQCTEQLKLQLNEEVYNQAKQFRIQSYAKCKTINDIKYALVNYGPVLASIKWYDDYELLDDGIIKMNKKSDFGYHAIMIYGYDEEGWLIQNSWGKKWNKNGRFKYSYTDKLLEAWSFVDATNSDVYIPVKNSLFDYIYKIANYVINFILKFFQ